MIIAPHLDLGDHCEVRAFLEHLNREYGVTVIMALHDLQQAVWSAHRLVVLQEGYLVRQGAPQQVLTSALSAAPLGVKARGIWHAKTGRRSCILVG
jgi:iron complex transport system ATP-binding protein